MKTFLKILLASLLFLPATALATTAVPWSITNLTDGFIFPNLVNGSAKGILVSASSTFNGNLSVSTLTNGDCVQAGVGGILVSASSACGSGGSTPGGLNLQVQYNNAGAFGGISGAVTNGTILNLTNPLLGGATLTTSVVNGVTLTSAGSATSYLNGTGAYSVPVGTTYTATYPVLVTGTVISTALSSSTLTASSPLTGSFAQVGTGGSLGIQVANTSQNGYLSSTDWNTFNNKQPAGNYATFGYLFPNNATTSALTLGGLTVSGIGAGTVNANSAGGFYTSATTTVSCTGNATCSPFTVFGASPFTINVAAGTAASSTLLGDSNTFSGNNTFTQLITGSISGNAGTATKLATGRTISITGDLAYTSPSFDGSGNVTAAGTLATVNSNVGTFTYPSVTVNGKGLVTAISNGTAPTTYTGTAPIFVSGSTIGTSFSTSTFNAFSAENTFTSLFATNASSTNATTTTLAIVGGASNCNGTSALTTNSSGVVQCTAQPQGTVTALTVATANGFAGSSSGGATPALTLTTTVTGLLKGNGTAITAASNGTDYTLVTANTCGAGQFFNAGTAAGIFSCGTPAGTTYTGTFPIVVTGSAISSSYSTTTNTGLAQGIRYIGSGGIDQIAASSSLFGFTPQPAGNYITALTGDGTASGPGSVAFTLATVNSNVGTFNNLTVNAKGLVTAASNIAYDTFAYPFPSNATTSSLTFGGITLTGAATGCATFTTGVLSSTGSACGSGSGSAYPFPLTGNATSTLTQFNGGLTAFGSSTIGNGLAGLTVSGNATTTGNAFISGNLGLGTSTPFAKFAIQSNNGDTATTLFAIGSSTQTATSTLYAISNKGVHSFGDILGSALGAIGSWNIFNQGGNLFFGTSTGLFGTSTNGNPNKGFIEFPNNGGCIGCTDIAFAGVNLLNATYVNATTSAITANSFTDIYTTPAGRRTIVIGWSTYKVNAGSSVVRFYIKHSGVYYPVAASTTLTTLTSNGQVIAYVLDPGESISILQDTTSTFPIWLNMIEYDASSPLYSAKVFSPASGTTTIYTVPTGSSAEVLPTSLNITSNNGGAMFNFSNQNAVASVVTPFILKPTQGASNTLNQSAIAVSGGANATVVGSAVANSNSGGGFKMSSGDSVAFSLTNSLGTGGLLYINVVEH